MSERVDGRQRAAEQAREHLTRAAAALTEWWTADNLAFALLEAGQGLYSIAQLDHERIAYDRVQQSLAALLRDQPV